MKYSLILVLFIFGKIYSQDAIFSQYFLIPETINTSFTGSLQSAKLGVVHRSQWTNFGFKVNSNFAYIDTWIGKFNSGLGISILNHTENSTKYNFNEVNLNYALSFQISEDWYLRPSISAGFGMKDYGFQNILLEDQININSGIFNMNTIDPILLNENRSFMDFSSSILFNNENSWIGLTVKHLNKPNISMTDDGNTPLDIFVSLHSSLMIPLYRLTNKRISDSNSLYFLTNLMKQGRYSRVDIGSQYVYDNKFSIGVVLASNPFKNDLNSQILTSINVFAGFKWEGFRYGYSYDANTSNIGQTGGVHEFSIAYDFSVNIREINRFKCVRSF